MTDTPTRKLTEFSVKPAYDQIHLDTGDTRYFLYPEKAAEMADALRRAAAVLRPSAPEAPARIYECKVSKFFGSAGLIQLEIAGTQHVLSPGLALDLAESLRRNAAGEPGID